MTVFVLVVFSLVILSALAIAIEQAVYWRRAAKSAEAELSGDAELNRLRKEVAELTDELEASDAAYEWVIAQSTREHSHEVGGTG